MDRGRESGREEVIVIYKYWYDRLVGHQPSVV